MATNNAIDVSYPIPISLGGIKESTVTNHGVLVGFGENAIVSLSAGTNGQLLIAASGPNPAFATLTSTGSTFTFTTGANTLNIEAVEVAWSEITSETKTIVINEAYIANYATLLTFTLPTTSAVGSRFIIVGKGDGGWRVAQGSGQTIHIGPSSTTTGATGHIDSSNDNDTVEAICTVADTEWIVRYYVGTINVT